MSESIWDVDAPIGRRSVPRQANEVPASGVRWNGPTEFVIKEEQPGAFRWIMISGDGRHLQLAQSPSFHQSPMACEAEIRRFDPSSTISFK